MNIHPYPTQRQKKSGHCPCGLGRGLLDTWHGTRIMTGQPEVIGQKGRASGSIADQDLWRKFSWAPFTGATSD